MGILSGLEKFGLDNLDESTLFDTGNQTAAAKTTDSEKEVVAEKVETVSELDYLYDKSYTCPVCDSLFTAKTVRNGKAPSIGTDVDLRPRYENIDVIKYEAVVCPFCGYASLSKSVGGLTTRQIHAIREKISMNYIPQIEKKNEPYTYDEAIERYKLVLANALVKQSKAGEKAFILLKLGWLLRGKSETLDLNVPANRVMKKVYQGQEKQYLKNAVEGFETAKMTEPFPIVGMDEMTLDFMISALHVLIGNFKDAEILLGHMITSTTVPKRIKDKARELRELMEEKKKEQNS